MKRLLLLVTVALMLAAAMALSGLAQAAPIDGKADAQCAKLAKRTLGPSYNSSNYTFIGGTEGIDNFNGRATDGPDVFCGFGGDELTRTIDESDIFLGGEGNDSVSTNYGTFYGGAGNDTQLDGIARDGQRDKLYYGKGRDEYVAGKNDYVDTSCEKKVSPEWLDSLGHW